MRSLNNIFYFFIIVCGFSVTACEEALEKPLTDVQVVLLAPVDSLVSTPVTQTFYWEIVPGATKYQLAIVSPKFDSIVKLITDTTITNNQFSYTLPVGKYQWRVRAINNSSNSAYSSIRKIVIQ